MDHLRYQADGAELRTAGGAVTNIACALARMGARVCLAGVVGEDADGEIIIAQANDHGVDTSLVFRPRRKTTRTLEIDALPDEKSGVRHVFHHSPPRSDWAAPADWRPAESDRALANAARWLHLDVSNRRALRLAEAFRQANRPVSFDFGRPPLWGMDAILRVVEHATVLKTNVHLLECLEVDRDASRLLERFPEMRIAHVTDEARGQFLLAKQKGGVARFDQSIVPAGRIVDTLGAGDASFARLLFETARCAETLDDDAIDELCAGYPETLWRCAVMGALCCRFPAARGYLDWMRAGNRDFEEVFADVRANGAIPADWGHGPAPPPILEEK